MKKGKVGLSDDEQNVFELVNNWEPPDWFNWRCSKWGTKWDIECENGVMSDDGLKLWFGTAWAPPIHAYRAAMERHGFDLLAYYWQGGDGFCGRFSKNEYFYSHYDKEPIPKDLREPRTILAFGDFCVS